MAHGSLEDGLKGVHCVLCECSGLHELVMVPVDMLHKPVNMQQVMCKVEPAIEDEEVNEDLLDQLQQSELILLAGPVSVIGSQMINLPEPNGSIQQ